MMVVHVGVLFVCISPLVVVFVLLWLLVRAPGFNLHSSRRLAARFSFFAPDELIWRRRAGRDYVLRRLR
eukprot:6196027-Pleurochrysis_carterae.AAC.2